MAAQTEELAFHPEAKAFLETSKRLVDEFAAKGPVSIETMRRSMDEVAKIGGPGAAKDFQGTREELFVDSKEVEGGIPVYVYKPKSVDHESDAVPILIYFHGGGNVMGSRDCVDSVCKVLSDQAGCIVVNVEYRLAPEHKFPAMMNDAYDAVRWVLHNRSSIGGTSKSKVGVAGDSAGGQISASVSHHIPGVDFQVTCVKPKFGAIFGIWHQWLETEVLEKKEDLRDPRFHALSHENYDHLPPTLLIVAEFDQLRDESYEYSKRLTAAGVENEVYLAKGAVHGFFSLPGPFPELGGPCYAKVAELINKVRK